MAAAGDARSRPTDEPSEIRAPCEDATEPAATICWEMPQNRGITTDACVTVHGGLSQFSRRKPASHGKGRFRRENGTVPFSPVGVRQRTRGDGYDHSGENRADQTNPDAYHSSLCLAVTGHRSRRLRSQPHTVYGDDPVGVVVTRLG